MAMTAEGGYTQDNCRVVCFQANMMKGPWSDKEMYEVAEAIVARRKKA